MMTKSNAKEDLEKSLLACVEMVDDKVPFIGPIMDLPIVNELEQVAVKMIVDYICDSEIDVEGMDATYGFHSSFWSM